tara:strand:- start:747 stop:902 length:156 start_codon:yes stop_codon:yes gene_type:complete
LILRGFHGQGQKRKEKTTKEKNSKTQPRLFSHNKKGGEQIPASFMDETHFE